MQIQAIASEPGGRSNEDRAGSGGAFAWMLDGVTGITSERLFPEEKSDAIWFAQNFDHALQALAPGKENPLDLLAAALRLVLARADQENPRWRTFPPHLLPAASLSLVHLGEEETTLLSIGDCINLVREKDGTLRQIGDQRVARHEEESVALLTRLQKIRPALPPAELSARLRPILSQQRRERNSARGFWVADLSERWLPELVCTTLATSSLAQILLCTDGLYRLCDVFGHFSQEEFFQRIARQGVATAIALVRQLEDADPDCTRFPRLKPADDATGLLISP
ncbi:protein phosphatase 2C domain-containing protein [Roseibacillus ishigakijimensis]|uniref:Protein phosphatase 2C domain-containing protein n=1 Tax=Roseibacillus ishigakijimensis TaxID=454146 RepID=A0A934VKK2_9BACT|nr:protein phosphatase 2C domain-containing protein [Roseibacillus ishigakijimensis]MBK1833734.1 protein phosphatase 2C domain-containing protein [Roseibacillus ishigakijimensis]